MHCGVDVGTLERAGCDHLVRRHIHMTRFCLLIPLLLTASAASAQQRGHDACARDVARHCRAVMNDGDSAVLACLQQNRSHISKACEKVLVEHGQ
jgi:hypothetical protein